MEFSLLFEFFVPALESFFSAPRKAPNRCFIWLSEPSFLTVSEIKNAAIKELVA